MQSRRLSVASRASVALKILLVGGEPRSLCAHAHTRRHRARWRIFAAVVDALFYPLERNHVRNAWEFWQR